MIKPPFHTAKFEALKSDGSLTKSDEETGEVFCKYFEKVLNNIRPIDESALEDISQREVPHDRGIIPLPMKVQNAMKRWPIAKLLVTIKSPLRPISILPTTISIILYYYC